MQRIKLNERQILMLKKLEQEESKNNKVLRITESQYNRLFKDKGKGSKNLSKSLKKAGLEEGKTKKIDLVDFAQELVVFIKDILSNPRTMSFSPYWDKLGISKPQLFNMVKDQGLLALADGNSEVKEYITPKYGFRRNVKELYNKISEKLESLNEFGDGGYPAGASNDSSAPWNQDDGGSDPEIESGIKANKKILDLVYCSDDSEGVCIFKKGSDLFYVTIHDLVTKKGEKLEPYLDSNQTFDDIDGETVYHYVNDKLARKQIKAFSKNAPEGELALITPELKQKLISLYGDDKTLTSILNNVEETSSAASSGAYVGGGSFNGPIKKDTGLSPEEAMGELINDAIDPSGVVQFYKEKNGENTFMIDGVKWRHVWAKDENGKTDNGVYRIGQDITYSLDWFEKNILKRNNESMREAKISESQDSDRLAILINTAINQVDDSLGYTDFAEAVAKILADNYGSHLFMPFLEALTNFLPIDLGETTSTATVGAGVGANGQGTQTTPQYAYDAPAGDGKDFWTAGNKQNKKMGKNGTPIVRGGSMNEGIKVGQVYKNGLARRKVKDIKKHPLTQSKKVIVVQQWGDGDNREIKIDPKEWGNWELLIERKILKVTEEQLKKIIESENMSKTAYPNGEMVSFDDCTKFNNNTKAQDGGCSTGAVDGVVKTSKTKGSVVSK